MPPQSAPRDAHDRCSIIAPFAVAEFMAHESKLQFGSLNHALDRVINGQTARLLLEGQRTYGRLREIDANDPLWTFGAMAAAKNVLQQADGIADLGRHNLAVLFAKIPYSNNTSAADVTFRAAQWLLGSAFVVP
jgi:hypothetical protein